MAYVWSLWRNFWLLYDVMTYMYFLKSWPTFSHHNIFQYFLTHILTCVLHFDVKTLFYVLSYLITHILTSWRIFILFDVIAYFVMLIKAKGKIIQCVKYVRFLHHILINNILCLCPILKIGLRDYALSAFFFAIIFHLSLKHPFIIKYHYVTQLFVSLPITYHIITPLHILLPNFIQYLCCHLFALWHMLSYN